MTKKKLLHLSEVYRLIEPGPVVMLTTAGKDRFNIMTMSWHTMIDFEPPIVACVVSDRNYSFELLKETKECVINIPSSELLTKVVRVGNCSGRKIDKFSKFQLTVDNGNKVKPPLIRECFANLECIVIDMHMACKYNLFILEVVHAWINPTKKRQRMIHHAGHGVFVMDGKIQRVPSKMK